MAAQTGTLKEQVVGTSAYVSVDTVRPDGSRQPMYGTNPQGLAVFDGSGHYILMTSRADIAKFASANRMEGTPEDNKAVARAVDDGGFERRHSGSGPAGAEMIPER